MLISWQKRYTKTIGKLVKFIRKYAKGIDITHTEILSNKNVIKVFPPERIVKYDAFINASSGIHKAIIIIK